MVDLGRVRIVHAYYRSGVNCAGKLTASTEYVVDSHTIPLG